MDRFEPWGRHVVRSAGLLAVSAAVLVPAPRNLIAAEEAAELAARGRELAEGVKSDDVALVGKIREFILSHSGEATSSDMLPYQGTIPMTGVAYEMVAIPGGTFLMGSPDGEPGRGDDEGPQREVAVEPFWMGKFEVTWNQFEPFMITNAPRNRDGSPRSLPPDAALADFVSSPTAPYLTMDYGMGKDGYPAISMTQHAACKFCQWLSAQTGHYYRLPTEAEWEYACRAGSQSAYSFGDDAGPLDEFAIYWHDDGPDQYAKVGTKRPNPWGLFDMHGNVSEWCLDQYLADAYQREAVVVLPKQLHPRAYRGGSWDDDPENLRSAARFASSRKFQQQDPELPTSLWYNTDASWLGFRVVRPLAVPTTEVMERLWNCGDVSERAEWNEEVQARRRVPIPRE